MKLSIATIFISLCGAGLAAPTNSPQNEKRIFPFPSPGEGSETEPEPTMPFPNFPFPTEPGEPPESSGLPWLSPVQSMGAGQSCGGVPVDMLSELGEWSPVAQLGAGEEEGRSDALMVKVEESEEDSGTLLS
ncbi:hypothetical protein BJX76DRAFT_343988 [Aspergillus varians]